MRYSKTKTLAFSLLASLSLATEVIAESSQLTVTGIAASDWLYHGTTESDGNPVVGANLEWNHAQGFFAGLQAHQAKEKGPRQRERALMGYVGYTLIRPEGWSPSVAVTRREFLDAVKDWQYTELTLQFQHANGVSIRADYAADYYAHKTRSLALEVDYGFMLSELWYGQVKVGRLELSNSRWLDHHYAQVSVGRLVQSLNVELTAHWNSRGDGQAFGQERYSEPGLALQVGWRIW